MFLTIIIGCMLIPVSMLLNLLCWVSTGIGICWNFLSLLLQIVGSSILFLIKSVLLKYLPFPFKFIVDLVEYLAKSPVLIGLVSLTLVFVGLFCLYWAWEAYFHPPSLGSSAPVELPESPSSQSSEVSEDPVVEPLVGEPVCLSKKVTLPTESNILNEATKSDTNNSSGYFWYYFGVGCCFVTVGGLLWYYPNECVSLITSIGSLIASAFGSTGGSGTTSDSHSGNGEAPSSGGGSPGLPPSSPKPRTAFRPNTSMLKEPKQNTVLLDELAKQRAVADRNRDAFLGKKPPQVPPMAPTRRR